MWNIFRWIFGLPAVLVAYFISKLADDITSRITSHVIDTFHQSTSESNKGTPESSKGQSNKGTSESRKGQSNKGTSESNKRQLDRGPSKKISKLLTARDLKIAHSNNNNYWKWIPQSQSRFTEVAELLLVWWLDVHARIKFNALLADTNYAAHLIFVTRQNSRGLKTFQVASVSMGNLQWKKDVCVKPRVANPPNKGNVFPIKRSDGWMELELGQFYCDGGAGEVVVGLKETSDHNPKKGLIIAGIELRPI